jgi:hypothetical protein
VSTWTVVGPVVKTLAPYAKAKVLGSDLDKELAKAVSQAWEAAAGKLCNEAEAPCDPADLEAIGTVFGRAINVAGTARAFVTSLLDATRPSTGRSIRRPPRSWPAWTRPPPPWIPASSGTASSLPCARRWSAPPPATASSSSQWWPKILDGGFQSVPIRRLRSKTWCRRTGSCIPGN